MGVIGFYFVDNEVEVRCRQKVIDCAYIICRQAGPLSLSAQLVQVLVANHRLQSLLLLSVDSFLNIAFLSGARSALPMGVAPEAIAEIF
jgi:hypothetical protein